MTQNAGPPVRVVAAPAAAPSATNTPAATICGDSSAPTWTPVIVASTNVACGGGITARGASEGAVGGAGMAAAAELPSGTDQVVYALSGGANADTQPTNAPPEKWDLNKITSGEYHPGSEIVYMVYQNTTQMDAPLTGPDYKVTTTKLTNGVTARLSVPTNGYGAVKVEWVANNKSYLLLTSNLKTSSGTSGVNVTDLQKMASSVR